MRGKPRHDHARCRLRRFIPAHAGKASASTVVPGICTVHPRACGESACAVGYADYLVGSSPRMRGKPCVQGLCAALARFIPAHAGKARPLSPLLSLSPVHPRACGESSRDVPVIPIPAGSSPRMRGKRGQELRPRPHHRFIPAHAGKATSW